MEVLNGLSKKTPIGDSAMEDQQKRANECNAELQILLKKYDCVLIVQRQEIGISNNVSINMQVLIQANPKK